MTWLIVALAGHLANAGAFVIDKILLSKSIKQPSVYIFYVGLLGGLALILIPFVGLSRLSVSLMIECALAGASFMYALYFFFSALKRGEASRVVPIVGAMVPIWTLGFAALFLGESLVGWQSYGIILLIIGAILISYEGSAGSGAVSLLEATFAVVAAGLFAYSYTITKDVFNNAAFLNAFIWMRIFALLSVLPVLVAPGTRRAVFGGDKDAQPPTALFFVGQILGASGFVLLNIAIKLAPQVSIVNALQGVQYGFLFIIIGIITIFAPRVLKEKLTKGIVIQKIIALFALSCGLVLAALV